MSDNVITIIGNMTRDPEVSFTKSGMALAKFGVAVNRKWQNRQTNEWEEKTSFIDVVCWGKLGENVGDTLGKGDRVIVMGRMDQDTWEDKETGKNRSKHEIVADSVGAELRWATASITKNPKGDGHGSSNREPDFGYGDRGGSGGGGRSEPDYEEEPFLRLAESWDL